MGIENSGCECYLIKSDHVIYLGEVSVALDSAKALLPAKAYSSYGERIRLVSLADQQSCFYFIERRFLLNGQETYILVQDKYEEPSSRELRIENGYITQLKGFRQGLSAKEKRQKAKEMLEAFITSK